jgi:predicted ATPase/DNA-binding XRE family transcriptional regulator
VEEERPAQPSVFGDLLRRHRLEAGLSQQELAERARMSPRGISALERGERRTPQRETLALLADALALAGERRRAFEAAANPTGTRKPGGHAAVNGSGRTDGTGRTDDTGGPAYSSTLPLSLTSFVGRGAELAEIAQLLRVHRLVTVTGAGGIGKTRTALEVGETLFETGIGDVRLVELGTFGNAERVAPAIAHALGLRESPHRTPLEALVTFLERKTLTIVLDNCEHMLAEVRTVTSELLRHCADVRVLATSREPLNMGGERVYLLEPLPAPEPEARPTPKELLAFDAPLLFVDRAAAADHRFALTDENAPQVAELCRRLDGMPLALELAAARVRVFSPSELTRMLDDRFELLKGRDDTMPPRQHTIRALLDWSYDLLTAREQRLFRTLAIFAGGFTFGTVAALLRELGESDDDVLDLLSSLLEKSLVRKDPSSERSRYRLLESMQHYARQLLVEQDEYDAAAAAHAAAFLSIAESLAAGYATMPEDDWRLRIVPELENWQAAMRWSLEERHAPELGRKLAGALRWTFTVYPSSVRRRWTAAALAEVDADTPAATIAALHLAEAHDHSWLTATASSALEATQRALSFLDPGEPAHAVALAEAKWRAGNAMVFVGDVGEAKRLLHEALEAFRRLGLPKLTCFALFSLSLACSRTGDIAEVRFHSEAALSIARECRLPFAANLVLGNLADMEFRAGEVQTALRLAQEATAQARAIGADFERCLHLCNLSAFSMELGDFAASRASAREALELSRDIDTAFLAVIAQQHLAAVAALEGHASARDLTPALEQAARVLGSVSAWLAALKAEREYTEKREFELLSAVLAASLGRDRFEALLREGGLWQDALATRVALEL